MGQIALNSFPSRPARSPLSLQYSRLFHLSVYQGPRTRCSFFQPLILPYNFTALVPNP